MDSAPPTAATDQPADDAGHAPQCAHPDCPNPAPKGPTGRPKQYCSRSCRSKIDRLKAKARAAAAEDTAPSPTAAPCSAAPPTPATAAETDDALAHLGQDGQHLLGIADALRRRLTRFLEETTTGDPATAFAELARVLPAYGTRAYMAAQEIRDKARWPHLSAHERVVARSRERIDRWGLDGPDDDGAAPEETNASRGETPAPAATVPAATAPATEPTPATEAAAEEAPAWRSAADVAEQARRTACTDPETRFDFPDLLDDLEVTFGPGWELGSWLTPDAKGVLQLRHHSRPVGWTAPLPDGPWGQAGWIALLYQPRGTARLLVDHFSRPKTHPSSNLALDAILRAHQTTRPAPAR